MYNYTFFFSYANRDKNSKLDRFFKELSESVSQKLGDREISASNVAFRDETSIRLGDDWSHEIRSALKESQIIVCNFSPHYFGSDYCGKEIGVFQKRIKMLEEKDREPVIIPVFWEKSELCTIPESLLYLQNKQSKYCALYQEHGLHSLLKRQHEAEYQHTVDILSDDIVKTVKSFSLPKIEGDLNLDDVPSAFSQNRQNHEETLTSGKGSPIAKFIFVVGKKSEMRPFRNNLESYGDEEEKDWKPFDTSKKIWRIAQEIASEKDLEYSRVRIGENLISEIKSEEMKSIAIVIVDPWSLKIDLYKKHMQLYDEISLINSEILVLWKTTDEETLNNLEELKLNLQRTFYHYKFGAHVLRDEITSQQELEIYLGIALEAARRRIMEVAEVFLPTELSSGRKSIPYITGPQ